MAPVGGAVDKIQSIGMLVVPDGETFSTLTVLIVEDDPVIQNVLATALTTELECQVTCVSDGGAARQHLDTGPVDLVILDRMLPAVDGLEICRQIREHQAWTPSEVHLPILMVTVLDQVADQHAWFAAGADEYITKPFVLDTLLARVRVWLRSRRRALAACEQVRHEAAAREAAEQQVLRAQLKAIRLAARALAHEINNDLALGVGVLELLQERSHVPPDLTPLVSTAREGLAHVADTVAQLHAVAQMEVQDTPIRPAAAPGCSCTEADG